jgi:hypothetical protein
VQPGRLPVQPGPPHRPARHSLGAHENADIFCFRSQSGGERECSRGACLCSQGRRTDRRGTVWELIACDVCGAAALHIQCGRLNPLQPVFIHRLVGTGIVRAARNRLFMLINIQPEALRAPPRVADSMLHFHPPKNLKIVSGTRTWGARVKMCMVR